MANKRHRRVAANKVVLVFLWTTICVLFNVTTTSALETEDPPSFFGSTNHDAYLDWLVNNQALSYNNAVFLPAPSGPENGVALHWSLDEDNIYLAVAARATGWVGFGIAENGGMRGADMVLFEAANKDTVLDEYVLDDIYAGPSMDNCQSWTLLNSQTDGGFLIFEAVRLLDTGDSQDRPIFNDASIDVAPSRIIAAWGDSPEVEYHGPNSRVRSAVRFFGSSNNGGNVEVDIFRAAMDTQAEGFIDLRAQDYPIKPIETEYANFCFSFSSLVEEQGLPSDTELHVVGIEPIIDPDAQKYVHHLVVYGEEEDWGTSGVPCDFSFGDNMAYVWAPGEGPLKLPENVGAPLGKNSFVSFQLQIHFNNPTMDAGVLDSSGVRFYYTSKKREHDLGVLQVGDPLIGLFGQSVGNVNTLTQHTFDCPSSCAEMALSSVGEVTVLREFLHMHQSGMRMYNRQIRQGEVVRDGKCDFWDFVQQGTFAVQQEPFTIKPGDSFQTSCYYKTQDEPKRFGLSSQAEMCMAFLFYYPRVMIQDTIPYICGYNEVDFCDADWEMVQLENTSADLERTFGDPTAVCKSVQNEVSTSGGGVLTHVRLVFGFLTLFAAATGF